MVGSLRQANSNAAFIGGPKSVLILRYCTLILIMLSRGLSGPPTALVGAACTEDVPWSESRLDSVVSLVV